MGPEPEIGKLEPEKGSLYTLANTCQVKRHLRKVSISNGLAWNSQLQKMYYIDSPLRTVDQYDYDVTKNEISTYVHYCDISLARVFITSLFL